VNPARRKLYSYLAVVALYVLVFGWWMFFFLRQADYLLARMARQGIELAPEQALALRNASDTSMRMFLVEGAFLGVMLAASVALVVRSLHREVALHRQQRNFLSAVTHELKSPIASARLYVESLLLGRAEGEKRERYMRHALEDLDRLRVLVEDLLTSAQLASTGPIVHPERIDLARYAEGELPRLVREESREKAELSLRTQGPVPVDVDGKALETMLRNLISNAVKYAGDDPRLEIEVGRDDSQALLRVRDHGRGLAGADAERIFDPFVRGGDENVRTRPGAGLGLYIVRELARAHQGDVRALDAQSGGFQIEIRLPLASAGGPA
jgi:two-component system phosphate regulon sensor histidine kinase PhoR